MKKIIQSVLIVFSFLATSNAIAQQGFGTNQPDKSAAVDIVSSKRGLLIPRIALTSTTAATPVNSPAESLLVYNTATVSDVTPGYYYWDTTKWVRFVSSSTEKTVTVTEGENVTVTESNPDGNTTQYEVAVKAGAAKQVLVTKSDGSGTEWVNPADFIADVVTASNGLQEVGNDVQLGGVLDRATEIITTTGNTLAIVGLEDISTTSFNSATQNIVIMGADGVLKVVSPRTLVAANETITKLEVNADGSFTYYNESEVDAAGNVITGATGVTIDFDAVNVSYDNTTSKLVASNVQTALDEIVVKLTEGGGVELVDTADGSFNLVADDGTVLSTITKANLTDVGDGTYTFSNNDGTDITFDVKTVDVSLNSTSNIYEFKDAAGAVIGSIDMNASNVAYDNTTSGLLAEDVQAALDEIVVKLTEGGGVELVDTADGSFNLVADDGTVLSTITKANLTDVGDGTYTFSNNDGTDITFDVKTVDVSLNTTTNIYEFKDAAGDVIGSIDMNASNVAYDNTTSKLVAEDVQAAIDELASTIDTSKGDLTVEGGLEFYDTTDGVDKLLGDAKIQIKDGGITTDKIADGAVTNAKVGADAITTDKIVNGTILNEDIANKQITADKLNADGVTEGYVPTVNADGSVTYQEISATTLGKTLSTDGKIVIGTNGDSSLANAVLVETELKIAEGSITTTEIADGTILASDIANAGNNQVLVTSSTGEATWVDQSALKNKDSFTGTAPITVTPGTTLNANGGIDYTIDVNNANGTTLGVVKEADATPTINFVDGVATVNVDNISATQGKALTSSSITVSADGAKALLADTQIDITPGTAAGQVMVTNADNSGVEWVDPNTLGNTVTADNGLTKTGNNIQLGGDLTETNTVIGAAADKTLAITGLQNSTDASTSIVLADESTGVLRKVARSLEYAANSDFVVGTQSDYNMFVQEITILATIGTSDINITLPPAANAKGQVVNVKIANTTEPDAYVNIPNVDGTTIYGAMPYQGWILKSNGSTWSVVGSN